MGTCENLLKESCPITKEIHEVNDKEPNEVVDLQANITLKKLMECQQEIDNLGRNEYNEILEKLKTFDEVCKSTLKDRFKKRNEVIRKIPEFWVNAMCVNPKLPFQVNENEVNCLRYLSSFEMDELADKINDQAGFKVSFTFDDNPYVENNVISKQFSWGSDGIISSTSSIIMWKKHSESNSIQDELLKSLCSGSCSFFEWLADNEGPKSINFLQLLELWQDPVRYYMSSANYQSQNGDVFHDTLLEEVKNYQEDINKINKKLDDELENSTSVVGISSEELKRSLYEKRNRLIQEIPNFWATVISNHPDLTSMIEDDERDCLEYLINIELEDMKCSEDLVYKMSIHFYFAENNPYIANSVISKEFTRKDGERSVKNTPIEWKENKCLFSKKESGDGTCSLNERRASNFFDWLNDNSSPETNSHITLPVLQLWEDPVQFYIKAEFNDVFENCSHLCET